MKQAGHLSKGEVRLLLGQHFQLNEVGDADLYRQGAAESLTPRA